MRLQRGTSISMTQQKRVESDSHGVCVWNKTFEASRDLEAMRVAWGGPPRQAGLGEFFLLAGSMGVECVLNTRSTARSGT